MRLDRVTSKILATLRYLSAWLLVLAQVSISTAFAQNKDEGVSTAINLLSPKKLGADRAIEDRAKQIILHQLDPEQFLLTVETDLDPVKIREALGDKKEIRMKTLPRTVNRREIAKTFVEGVTSENVVLYFKTVKVNLVLDESVPESIEPILSRALTKGLSLRTDRGDKVTTTREKLNLVNSNKLKKELDDVSKEGSRNLEEARKLQTNVKALETQKLTLEAQRSQLETAKSSAEQRLQVALADLQTERNNTLTLKKRISELEDSLTEDKTPVGKWKRLLRGLELPATVVPIALVSLLVLAIFAALFISSSNRRTSSLAQGMESLAGALKEVGTAASRKPQNDYTIGAIAATPTQQPNQLSSGDNNQNYLAGGDHQIDINRQEAEAAWLLMQKSPYPMLSALKDWLSEDADLEKFVAFSDAIGVENARTLWAKFPRLEIEALNKMMFKPIPKSVAYGTVTQLYRYVSYELASRPKFFEELDLEFLVACTDAELSEAISRSDIETAACCLLFVSPKRASHLYELIENHQPRDLMSVLGRMAELSKDEALRHIESLRRETAELTISTGFALSSHLAVLLEGSTAEKKQAISAVLDADDKLSAEVRSRVVTFDDVMRLEREIVADLIGPFEPEQIAALFATISGTHANQIATLLSQKVMIAVREEYNRNNLKPSTRRKATVLGNRIQATIIIRVKQMADEGLVDLSSAPKQNRNQNDNQNENENEQDQEIEDVS